MKRRLCMYNRKEGICIIVDAYSTGKSIAPLLDTYAFKPVCIHIKSSPDLPSSLQHNPSDFAYSLTYDGRDIDSLVGAIQSIASSTPIQLIVAGSESGVELADHLNEIFGLPGNDFSKSHLRRNKFFMNEAVKVAGVKTVEQIKANAAAAIIDWSKTLSTDAWPVVLKPLDSQSGDHVFFCRNECDIENAFVNITSASTLFGQLNREVLAQGYNEGEEFIINSVSCDGHHFPVEIWRIKKRANTTIYEHADLVEPTSEEFRLLFDATCCALNAVGTRYGAGTTEFKLHPSHGPVFLETTSRPMAGSPLMLIHELLGYNQVTVMLEALLTPELFKNRLSQPLLPFSEEHYGLAVVLISDAEGVFQGELVNAFKDLATYKDGKLAIQNGSILHITTDSLTAPGEVYLMGKKEDVLRDYHAIRAYEANGLYRNAVANEEHAPTLTQGLISLVKETFFDVTSEDAVAATTLSLGSAELSTELN